MLKSLFDGLSETLISTLRQSGAQPQEAVNAKSKCDKDKQSSKNINDRVRDIMNRNALSQSHESADDATESVVTDIIDEDFTMFSDNDEFEQLEAHGYDDQFDYEMPKIFEDDEKFDTDASPSIAKVVENICKRKSDVSIMTKEMKIPGNCRSLAAPPVNMEIWQFLERKAKSSDLNTQIIQRLLGSGIVPIIKVA